MHRTRKPIAVACPSSLRVWTLVGVATRHHSVVSTSGGRVGDRLHLALPPRDMPVISGSTLGYELPLNCCAKLPRRWSTTYYPKELFDSPKVYKIYCTSKWYAVQVPCSAFSDYVKCVWPILCTYWNKRNIWYYLFLTITFLLYDHKRLQCDWWAHVDGLSRDRGIRSRCVMYWHIDAGLHETAWKAW